MRRIWLALALLLVASSAEAIPYIPDVMWATVLDVRFVETGTDTACLNCADADPSNDIQVLASFPDLEPSDPNFSGWSGLLDFTGTNATDFSTVDLHIEVDLKVFTQLTNAPPEEIAEFPLPSVGYGTLSGALFGIAPTQLIEECCDGLINGISFLEAFFPSSPFGIPDEHGSFLHQVSLEVFAHGEAPYTPEAIPEPSSLLLIASGLATVQRMRRRRS